MPLFTKRKTKLHLQVTNSDQATAHGGQVLVDALCRRAGLWKRLHDEPTLEVRKRTGAGFAPVANVAQLLFSRGETRTPRIRHSHEGSRWGLDTGTGSAVATAHDE